MAAKMVWARPSSITKSLICMDDYHAGNMKGRLFNPYCEQHPPFMNCLELVRMMERMMDNFAFPQPCFNERTFFRAQEQRAQPAGKEPQRKMSDEVFEDERGAKATFIVQIRFRRNATWQGTIEWVEKKQCRYFRSELEMLKLMDEAAGDCLQPEIGWDMSGGHAEE